jgi:catechol 2,3-dioxygenase-like lactoylglutathione lyase family enzyme
MLKVVELAFCCYAVTDMKRARAFYEGVLGLKPSTVNDSEHGQWTE